jgi:spermidine/putrescine transport system permease protein
MTKKKRWPYLYVAFILALTYVPIIVMAVYSFNASKISSVWGGWSFKWYETLFRDDDMWKALRNSLVLAALSCLCAVVIGTMGALGVHRKKTKLGGTIVYLSTLPIMLPEIILGMVFLSTFSLMGLPFGMTTLVIAHTSFCIPYIYSMVNARLIGMDKALEEAARDLGASPIQVFFDVTLPMILPAIFSGVILAFAMSFDDVVISIFMTGPTVNTLPIKIYTRIKTGVTPEINALSVILLITAAVLLGVSSLLSKRRKTN